jgi:hypothetical protein
MKLNVIERITLMQVLPKEGNYVTFKILISLKSALSFNEKEFKEFGMVEKDGLIHWKKSVDKEIEIGEKAREIIQEALKGLDKAGKLDERSFPLYEKFVETQKT